MEHDALIGSYVHLDRLPRAAEALHAIRKIASLVKPIMRNRGWKVGTLAEFFPAQQNLLGINVNHGQKICLRLRHAGDQTQFMPLEQVVDTMLHELSHNVHGPHNAEFHALWNSLRDEYTDLKLKGYSGEGFLSTGHRLGGRRIPMHEMRRQARASAERRRGQALSSGHRLGGAPVLLGIDIRAVIADAASRRAAITQGCASGTQEGEREAERASRNGFKTRAEEDKANEDAIAEALWELVQEEEARKAGVQRDAWAKDAGAWDANGGFEAVEPAKGMESPSGTGSRPATPVSYGGSGDLNTKPHPTPAPAPTWPCPICTLVNPGTYLICDACGVERAAPPGSDALNSGVSASRKTTGRSTSALPTPAAKRQRMEAVLADKAGHEKAKHLGWLCGWCGTFMENQWWTCSSCGRMKESS